MENWSFPDHKSDFKADQKIRKAMFLEKRKVVRDLGVASRRDRILLTFPFGPGEQVSFFILNPFNSQSWHSRFRTFRFSDKGVGEGGEALGIGFTAISTCIDPRRCRSRALLRRE